MQEPAELLRLLRDLCVPGLTYRQLQILGGCALGYSTEDIAAGLCLSRPTVFRHIEILESRVFDATDLTPSRHLLVAWAYTQKDCCSAGAWKMIENHQLFENGSHPRTSSTRQNPFVRSR